MLTQLHRHGARYPNEEDDYPKAVKHLLLAKEILDSSLYFLKDYEYDLPEEVLTAFGAEQWVSSWPAQETFSQLLHTGHLSLVRRRTVATDISPPRKCYRMYAHRASIASSNLRETGLSVSLSTFVYDDRT